MTISKRNGKYYCRFQINGERHHYLCDGATTAKEAEKIENAFKYKLLQQQNGVIPREEKVITFDALCNIYWNYAEANNKDLKHVKSKIKYFKEYFPKTSPITKILPNDILKYKNFLITSGKQPATVNKYISALKKMFNLAVENDLLNKNPCNSCKKLTEDNIQIKYWTIEEEKKFLQICPEWFKDIIICALHTGLRKSNIRLLQKSWINLDENLLIIPKSQNKGKKLIKIPISSVLRQIFLKLWDNGSDYIFINKIRKAPYSDDRLASMFNQICNDAGVPNIGFHGLRHTVGTRLAASGVDLMVVKELLAHSSLATTQRYTHVTEDRKIKAISILNSYN